MSIINKIKPSTKDLPWLIIAIALIYFLFFNIIPTAKQFYHEEVEQLYYKELNYLKTASEKDISIMLDNSCYSEGIKNLSDKGILINNLNLSEIKDNCDILEKNKKPYEEQKKILKGE